MIKKISRLLLTAIILLGGHTARCQWTTNNPGTNIAGGSGFGTNYSRTNVGGSYTFNTNYSRTNLGSTGYTFSTNATRTNVNSSGYSYNTNYSRTNITSSYAFNTNNSRTNLNGSGYAFSTNSSQTNVAAGNGFTTSGPGRFGVIVALTNVTAYWATNGGSGTGLIPTYFGIYSADSVRSTNGMTVFTNANGGGRVLVYGDPAWTTYSQTYYSGAKFWDLGLNFPDAGLNNYNNTNSATGASTPWFLFGNPSALRVFPFTFTITYTTNYGP
jgi:hypothetical protein